MGISHSAPDDSGGHAFTSLFSLLREALPNLNTVKSSKIIVLVVNLLFLCFRTRPSVPAVQEWTGL
jgi:hypothetical protein